MNGIVGEGAMRPRRISVLIGVASIQLLALAALRTDAIADADCIKSPRTCPPHALNRGRGVVPASYFGMHIHRPSAGSWPRAPFAGWRLWDTSTAWAWLEPARGQWRWERLDRQVELAQQRGVEVLLPLGMSPGWASARPGETSAYGVPGLAAEPASIADWRHYVGGIVARYRGRIRHFEIWNEPNVRHFYTGRVEQMVQLCREAYAVIKRADPRNVVVSPAAATMGGVPWLDRFLAAGGADCFDVVGFHFYVEPAAPEEVIALVAAVRRVMVAHGIDDRPLWNTESGWFIASKPSTSGDVSRRRALSQGDAVAYLARALILSRAAGIARFYWYAWDNHNMGLVDRDGSHKQVAGAFAEIQRWLVGAELLGCSKSSEAMWICPIERSGKSAWIIWSVSGLRRFSVPKSWRASTRRELSGARRRLNAGPIKIGPQPTLVEGTNVGSI